MSEVPGFDAPAASANAKSKVTAPAIAMMITAIFGILFDLYVIGSCCYVLTMGQEALGQAPQFQDVGMEQMQLGLGFYIVLFSLALVAHIVMIIGSLKMMKLQSYALAMTASVVASRTQYSSCPCSPAVRVSRW